MGKDCMSTFEKAIKLKDALFAQTTGNPILDSFHPFAANTRPTPDQEHSYTVKVTYPQNFFIDLEVARRELLAHGQSIPPVNDLLPKQIDGVTLDYYAGVSMLLSETPARDKNKKDVTQSQTATRPTFLTEMRQKNMRC
jgi:hypothetical protein